MISKNQEVVVDSMTIHYSTSLTQYKIVHSPIIDLQVVLLQSFEPSSLHGNSWFRNAHGARRIVYFCRIKYAATYDPEPWKTRIDRSV